ncbi:MAG: VWA domain-containing protein [Nanoarchaeota archaeon]|nr:VWA domain-containing protein [Nanoarchaeota archaeon]
MLLCLPAIIILIILIRKTFVKFATEKEKKEHEKSKKLSRILIAISRCLIFSILIIALASPFSLEEKTVQGDPSLTILADNSTSFELFEQDIASNLKLNLEKEIPTRIKYIAHGEESPIGDSLLNNMKGNDNLLLISDGNNNKGTSLGDVMMLASSLNTTISSLSINPIKTDLAVTIDSPSELIFGTEALLYVDVKQTGPFSLDYDIRVMIDDTVVIDEKATGTKTFEIKQMLRTGYHKIKASITASDYFRQNNVYYKTIHVLPKPKILFISQKDAKITKIMDTLYDVAKKSYMPKDLKPYSAVVLYNINEDWLKTNTDILTDYVADGNGLVVIGGDNSFDYGNYENSMFETILPVKVGLAGKEEESGMNIIIVMDVSGTTCSAFSSGSKNTKIDVEKAVATQIIGGLRAEDNIGVVTFDFNSHLVSPILPIMEKPDLNYTIATIQCGGYSAGTLVSAGLIRAEHMLRSTKGSKNIVLISDGITQYPKDAIAKAKSMTAQGIKTYAVGVGFDTNSQFMQDLALKGNGIYFEPTEAQRLNIIFSREYEEEETDVMGLLIIDLNHFITKNLDLSAKITGFNQVVPKTSARMLITTQNTNPIVSVWHFGLGRVAALTTDPEVWAGQLLNKENSKLITRTVNWAIGDPGRNKEFDVKLKDSRINDIAQINVISQTEPVLEGFSFSKITKNLYRASFVPKQTGFYDFFDASMAVNYKREYEDLGINPELIDLVSITNGRIFDKDNTTAIVEFIRENSRRKKIDEKSYTWILVLTALSIFLIEVCIRRIMENRKSI